jgi:hypothetical protein
MHEVHGFLLVGEVKEQPARPEAVTWRCGVEQPDIDTVPDPLLER